MISKSVIVFWSVVCLTITMNLMAKDPQGTGTIIYILVNGLLWAIVVIPTALIANVFKSQKVYSPKMRMIRGGALTAVGLLTFIVTNSSQQPKPAPIQNTQQKMIYQSTPGGYRLQPWVER